MRLRANPIRIHYIDVHYTLENELLPPQIAWHRRIKMKLI
jgi:hypothetical protein